MSRIRRYKSKNLKSQRGQVVIEYILYTVLVFGIVTALSKGLREMEFFNKITLGPWQKLAGVMESGVWVKGSGNTSAKARDQHPNHRSRNISCKPGSNGEKPTC